MPTSDNIYADNSVFQYNLSEEEQEEIRRLKEAEAATPVEAPVEAPKPPATQTPPQPTTQASQAPTAPAEEEGAMVEPEAEQEQQQESTPFGNNQMLEDNLPENLKVLLIWVLV